MITLNRIELQYAKSIINNGLQSAADSLSFFMKETITVEQIDIGDVTITNDGAGIKSKCSRAGGNATPVATWSATCATVDRVVPDRAPIHDKVSPST